MIDGVATAAPTHKFCPRCQTDKPATDFHPDRTKPGLLAAYCKPCSKAAIYEWREKNPARHAAINRRWQRRHGFSRQLARRYGLTVEEYQAMFEAQGGRCAICRQPETTRASNGSGAHRLLSVDHDHMTGRIRGLLCHRCNSAIEMFSEPGRIERLKEYLLAVT